MKTFLFALGIVICSSLSAQDTVRVGMNADSAMGTVTVIRDPRLDMLAKKEAELNSTVIKSAKGYRLMVISSNDRTLTMKVRSELLQQFPEQKVYMTFQSPFIKIKFGNFADKEEAIRYKKQIMSSKIVANNVYIIPETIEVKPDKNKPQDQVQ